MKTILYIPCIFLSVAVFSHNLPYDYYTLLRIVVAGISIYAALFLFKRDGFDFWILLGIALLYNPLIPVHLSRELWIPIDVIVGGYLCVTAYKVEI